jgi:hypothetical protein
MTDAFMDNKKATKEASDITMTPHVEDMNYLISCVYDCYGSLSLSFNDQ